MTESKSEESLTLEAALNLLRAGNNQQAINLLLELIDKHPSFVPFHVVLGLAYAKTNELGLEEASFRKALQLDPSEPTAQKALGLFLCAKKRYLEALPYLKLAFQQNQFEPSIVDALTLAIEETSGDEEEGPRILEKAYQRTKNTIYAIKLAYRYYIDNKPEKAIEILKFLPKDENSRLRDKYLARAYLSIDQYDEAISILTKALVEKADDEDLKQELSRTYNEIANRNRENGNLDEALEYCEMAISLDPNEVNAYINKSMVLDLQEKSDEVIITAGIGLQLVKNNESQTGKMEREILRLLKKIAYLKLGKEDLFMDEVFKELLLRPDDEFLIEEAVKFLIEKGEMQDALKTIEGSSIKGLSPTIFPYYYYLLHNFGRFEEAKSAFENFSKAERDPIIEEIIAIGSDGYLLGQTEAAISSFRQLVSFEPNNNRLNTNLGYFLIGESNFSEAEAHLNRVYSSKSGDVYENIACCDLVYMNCIQGNYDKAIELMEKQLTIEEQNQDAILRIPFFVFGEMKPDHAPLPGRRLTLGSAFFACSASALMATGDFYKSESNLRELSERNEQFLTKLLYGNLMLAKNQKEEAADYWRQALLLTTDEDDTKFINGLLKKM